MDNVRTIIKKLQLETLEIEGGFFRESYRSSYGTSIYYLLKNPQVSCWHQLKSDEIWYYHTGSPAIQMLIFPDGSSNTRIIGPDIAQGQNPQSLIPANTWQAARLLSPDNGIYGLFGAAVFPAFEYHDFSAATAVELSEKYPELKENILNFL